MKNVLKRIIRMVNETCYNTALKAIYRFKIKKSLGKSDYLNTVYKKKVIDYFNQFDLKLNLSWHKFYSSRNHIEDAKYIPEDLFYVYIEPYYNRTEFRLAYQDKCIYSTLYPDIKRPVEIAKNMNGQFYDGNFNPITFNDTIEQCASKDEIIIKPSIDSGGGRNISFLKENDQEKMKEKVMKEIRLFRYDFVIQEPIIQHKTLQQIYENSVNTIRTISFLKNGHVYILSSILRFGTNGSRVDNGGIAWGIQENGKLNDKGIDKNGILYSEHPDGFKFEKVYIPGYQQILETIKKEHIKLGHFRIVSWDFAVGETEEPIFIENNLRFQEINFHQLNNGPLFGDLTYEVLQEVFLKGNW